MVLFSFISYLHGMKFDEMFKSILSWKMAVHCLRDREDIDYEHPEIEVWLCTLLYQQDFHFIEE